MQLYILSPLLVWPLWKYGKKFLPVLGVLLWLWVITLFTYFVYGEYHMSILANDDRLMQTYTATHTRYGPWLIGILLAYLLRHQESRRVKVHWAVVVAGWVFSLGLIAAVIFGMQPLAQIDYTQHSQWADTMYGSLSILAWSLALSWIIWACVNGYGGPVNSFLSWTFWQPLGRLTYSMYLLHLPLQYIMIYGTKTHFNFSNVSAAYMVWGDFGFTLTVAIVWTLAFESPIITIEKFIFGRGSKSNVVKSKPKSAEA
jgi:peptidoglycan/LPS O-acetylase OafA/YrhL